MNWTDQTDNRQNNLRQIILISVTISVFLLLSLSTMAMAASWSPEKVIAAHIMNNYPWEDITVSNIKMIGKLPDKAPERIIVEKGPLGKSVFTFIDSTMQRTIVKANVTALGRIVKSRRSFRRGHVISADDIYVSKMNIRKMPRSSVRTLGEIIGKSLKRSIGANNPVVEDMIEMSRVVKRGKRVVILINHNGMNITSAGMTKEKGYIGMPVKAVNLSSKKVITGVLIDENTVKVEI